MQHAFQIKAVAMGILLPSIGYVEAPEGAFTAREGKRSDTYSAQVLASTRCHEESGKLAWLQEAADTSGWKGTQGPAELASRQAQEDVSEASGLRPGQGRNAQGSISSKDVIGATRPRLLDCVACRKWPAMHAWTTRLRSGELQHMAAPLATGNVGAPQGTCLRRMSHEEAEPGVWCKSCT